jgi:hypothetical protein
MTTNGTIITAILRAHLEDNHQAVVIKSIHTRSLARGGILRLHLEPGVTVIVKLWRIRNLKERIKSIARISNGWSEWRMHSRFHEKGVTVPEPIFFDKMALKNGEQWEVMAIEDLGHAETGLQYLKRLISTGAEDCVESFEKTLIDMTTQFVSMEIMDIDNQLNDYLVDRDSRVYRTDFECAYRPIMWKTAYRDYIKMIARLLTSHMHAVQPDTARTERFAKELYGRLGLDSRLKAMINKQMQAALEHEKNVTGIEMAMTLPD